MEVLDLDVGQWPEKETHELALWIPTPKNLTSLISLKFSLIDTQPDANLSHSTVGLIRN